MYQMRPNGLINLKNIIFIQKAQANVTAPHSESEGFMFAVSIGRADFQIRQSRGLPDEFTVMIPVTARSGQIKNLVNYLINVLAGQRIYLFDEKRGDYGEVDLKTLKFLAGESHVAPQSSHGFKNPANEDRITGWRFLPA
jgi:hypothetical protein